MFSLLLPKMKNKKTPTKPQKLKPKDSFLACLSSWSYPEAVLTNNDFEH